MRRLTPACLFAAALVAAVIVVACLGHMHVTPPDLPVALAAEPDSDGDGCPDAIESGPDEGLGGQRDPGSRWDYFNPTHDGENRVDDILAVVEHYFLDEGQEGYSIDYDRTLLGPNEWNLGPPNGEIRVDDIVHALKQYFHDCGPIAKTSTLARPADPVVLKGADVPSLQGIPPGDLVAFRWNGGWEQIPVQVDERDMVDFGQVYNGGWGGGILEEQYTDPNTFAGPDSDPTVDSNDEIAFMANDAGGRPEAFSEPAGVVADSGVEVRLSDPLDVGVGYIYLFVQTGGLDPAAGQQYVAYDFVLLSGDYMETYDLDGGPGSSHGPQVNEEDSLITTAFYERHWSYRWTNDDLRIFLGSGVDILEKRDYWIAEGSCGRHNATFNAGEGAFFVNKSGPVRAIRSYMGANSGPLTQGEHIYYERREDTTAIARVHARSATGTFYNDYSLDAIGMTYANDYNPAGLTIDGVPDPQYVAGTPSWEMVTGSQGSMVITHDYFTDIPNYFDGATSYYHDELNTSVNICQECEEAPTEVCPEVVVISDQHLIGAHGPYGTSYLPTTDPRDEEHYHLSAASVHYFDAPGLTAEDAELRREWVSNPLGVSLRPWTSGGAASAPVSSVCGAMLSGGAGG